MKKQFCIALTALFASLSAAAFEAPQFQLLREHLDSDGCRITIYNPAHLKDMIRTIFDSTSKGFEKNAKKVPNNAAGAQPAQLVLSALKQFGQATGASRIGCIGGSAKEAAGSTADNPLFINKSIVLLGAGDKPDFISAFSGGNAVRLDAIAKLPENTLVSATFTFHPEIMTDALRRINAITVLLLKAEQDFQTANGFPLSELLKSTDGTVTVAAAGDDKKVAYLIAIPDKDAKLTAVLAKDEQFKGQFRSADGRVLLSNDFTAFDSAPGRPTLADNADFKRFAAGGVPESGTVILYVSPRLLSVAAQHMADDDENVDATGSISCLAVGNLTEKHCEFITVAPFCDASVLAAAPMLVSDAIGISAAYVINKLESNQECAAAGKCAAANGEKEE